MGCGVRSGLHVAGWFDERPHIDVKKPPNISARRLEILSANPAQAGVKPSIDMRTIPHQIRLCNIFRASIAICANISRVKPHSRLILFSGTYGKT